MKITVYTTETCPFCKQVKEYLKENKIEFKEVDVGADPEKAKEMIELSGQMGVPVIILDKEVLVGFDEKKLSKKLGLSS